MQVASVMTSRPSLRAEIEGWSFEDSSLAVSPIGMTPSPRNIPNYTCVLFMIADGWALLGPPVESHITVAKTSGGKAVTSVVYDWMLTRDKKEGE